MLASCSQQGGMLSDNAAGDSTALRIAVMPISDCDPLYYAHRTGLADSMGLNIVLEEYTSLMDIDTALQKGRCDVYLHDSVRLSRIKVDSMRPVWLFPTGHEEWLIANKTKRIRKMTDLKEHMVAAIRWSQMDEWLTEILNEIHYDETDVFRPQINDVTLRAFMLDEGRLECAVLPHPYCDSLVSRGHIRLARRKMPKVGMYAAPAALKDSVTKSQVELLEVVYTEAKSRMGK